MKWLITLEIDVKTTEEEDPIDWDWYTLLDKEPTEVRIIKAVPCE